ncbi:hypothetical protein Phum_PHUM511920 [Pediculus humanus corporis]|uniref:Uncharacterized protein n=1 Tax=Pediculus humanus subsp. corporis TaxID=121224 RepID=E0VY93_PEDHC|nr:uncharacterized protein Phum_PHUM511920 [Pediculus humanus corporis]EEB18349.1 hypothetical protein Phum_PHUM511920 [Pediculus humanus corporis]
MTFFRRTYIMDLKVKRLRGSRVSRLSLSKHQTNSSGGGIYYNKKQKAGKLSGIVPETTTKQETCEKGFLCDSLSGAKLITTLPNFQWKIKKNCNGGIVLKYKLKEIKWAHTMLTIYGTFINQLGLNN